MTTPYILNYLSSVVSETEGVSVVYCLIPRRYCLTCKSSQVCLTPLAERTDTQFYSHFRGTSRAMSSNTRQVRPNMWSRYSHLGLVNRCFSTILAVLFQLKYQLYEVIHQHGDTNDVLVTTLAGVFKRNKWQLVGSFRCCLRLLNCCLKT